MRTRIIFEDNSEMCISKLIEFAYTGQETEVIFTGGKDNIVKYIAAPEDVTTIIFVDVVPGMSSLMRTYNTLVEAVKYRNIVNTFIIPIPCIEYYVIRAFGNKSMKEVNNVINFGEFNIDEAEKKRSGNYKGSFEKHCKYILNRKLKRCMRNVNIANINEVNHDGIHHIKNCICGCDQIIMDDCKEKELMIKAWEVVSLLPVFADSKNNHTYIQKADIEEMCKKQIDWYNEYGSRLLEAGIIKAFEQIAY